MNNPLGIDQASGDAVSRGASSRDPADILRQQQAGLLACVHCGFCLNACPTYTRLGNEGDSPRGRLDLMRAVAEGRLDADDESFRLHIDQCLGCRACEPVCPSGVPYGFLLEHARAVIAETSGISWSTRMLIASYAGPLAPIAGPMSRLLRGSGLPRLLARMSFLPASIRFAMAMLASSSATVVPGMRPAGGARTGSRSLEADSPTATDVDISVQAERAGADPHALQGSHPPHGRGAGTTVSSAPSATAVQPSIRRRMNSTGAVEAVALLDGCVQDVLFARVNSATRKVLEAEGFRVVAAPAQQCCGALDAHAGRLERARELARANIAAFEASGADTVVVNAAGCGAMLKEYGHQLAADPQWSERATQFASRVMDLNEFLALRGVEPPNAVPVKLTWDAPCHLHHGQRIMAAPVQVLDSIDGVQRVPLRDSDECCGGAGLYGVHHPDLGGRVLADKLTAIAESGADVVVTSNPGCMMQIGAGLLLSGSDVRVMHPIEILAAAYPDRKNSE